MADDSVLAWLGVFGAVLLPIVAILRPPIASCGLIPRRAAIKGAITGGRLPSDSGVVAAFAGVGDGLSKFGGIACLPKAGSCLVAAPFAVPSPQPALSAAGVAGAGAGFG